MRFQIAARNGNPTPRVFCFHNLPELRFGGWKANAVLHLEKKIQLILTACAAILWR